MAEWAISAVVARPPYVEQETDDEDSPTINYERRSGEGVGGIENKVIRRIKEVDDSGKGTMPLLATVVDEEKKGKYN